MIGIMQTPWTAAFATAPRRSLDPGAALFHRDDPVTTVYLLVGGSVALTRSLPEGTTLCLHRAGAGDLVAAASLFSDRYHCDARAEAPSTLAVLPRAALSAALDRDGLARAALAASAHEVQALRARIEVLRLRRLADRLDAYLALFGPPEARGWARVADWIGVTPAALYRELARRKTPLS